MFALQHTHTQLRLFIGHCYLKEPSTLKRVKYIYTEKTDVFDGSANLWLVLYFHYSCQNSMVVCHFEVTLPVQLQMLSNHWI